MDTKKPLSDSTDIGPWSYRNWLRHLAGGITQGFYEVPLYSDAHITGDISDGVGPYKIKHAFSNGPHDPSLLLFVRSYFTQNDLPNFQKTDDSSFTGMSLADEIAVLVSLTTGARMVAGETTRTYDQDMKLDIVTGDLGRPTWFHPKSFMGKERRIIPGAMGTVLISDEVIQHFHKLSAAQATTLLRAARSYRDALWISEVEP